MEDVWQNRDLPVLTAAVEIHDRTGKTKIGVGEIARAAGLDEEVTVRALHSLYTERQDPFFEEGGHGFDGKLLFVGPPTGAARRAAGAWPTPESQIERVIAALLAAAEDEGRDKAERGKLKQIALGLRGVAYQVAIGALASAGGHYLTS